MISKNCSTSICTTRVLCISIFPPWFFYSWFYIFCKIFISKVALFFYIRRNWKRRDIKASHKDTINTLSRRVNKLMRTRAISNWLITWLTNGIRYSCRIIQSQCLIVHYKWTALPPGIITLYFSTCVVYPCIEFAWMFFAYKEKCASRCVNSQWKHYWFSHARFLPN